MTATNTVAQTTQERMRQRERVGEKARVLRDIDKAWRAFMDSSTFLPESLMDEPGVSGQWSIKDILAHVAAWDRETTRVVMEILRGDAPTWPIHEQMFTDLNHEADRHLTVNEARNRALSAHKALVEMLDGKAEVRAEWVRGTTYEHYPEHSEEIVRWRAANPRVPNLTRSRSAGAAGEVDTPDPESGQEHVPTPEISPSLRPPLR